MHAINTNDVKFVVRAARALLFTLILAGSSSMSLGAERLYLFTQNYPPLHSSKSGKAFAHSSDEIEGVCSDMVKTLLASTDYEYVMKMREWSYSLEWVQGRKNHGVFCTARTADREDLFQWVGPLMSLTWTLFSAPNTDITVSTLEDARDLRIAGYKGDVMSEYLLSNGFNMTMGASGDVSVRRLMLGQVDLWVTDAIMGPLVAQAEYGIEGLIPVLQFRETPLYLALSTETPPEIVAKLQDATDTVRNSGTMEEKTSSSE